MTGRESSKSGDERVVAQQRAWAIGRRRVLQAMGLSAAALAFGQMPTARRGVAAAAQDGEPKAGGSLSMSLADNDVQSFDPITVTDNMSIWTQLLVYDQLVRVAPDGLSVEPGLAESWDVSEDAKTYTFHLRDATFHDGAPVTADDVVFSLNRAISDDTSLWTFLFTAVASVEAVDDKTVVATLSETWAPFEAVMALFAASIFPQKLYEEQGDELWQHPIGSGPFMFDSWNKGVEIVLKKNPNYWVAGQPYLDEVHLQVLTDSNARMLQFQAGELDIATDVPFSQLDALRANPDAIVLQDAVARLDYYPMLNTRPPFDDAKLRLAMNYAIDRDAIIQNVLFGAGQPATTYLPLMWGHDAEAPGYPHDLDKAKALIAESAAKDGFAAELLIDAGDPVRAQVAQLVAADLAQIGGQITITQLDPAALSDRRNSMDYQIAAQYYTSDIIDPDELTTVAVQSDGGVDSVWTGYKNEEVDKLVIEARTTLDPDRRLALYSQIQRLVAEDAPSLYLFYPTGRTATQAVIQNFHILPTGNYRLWETWRADA
ncbi:MAG: ABC transporter substrate-binding protein [Thermomicrobiales bacterium]|nr:ABC transporter substrate-binding protein [Thermomicrobiales bacterium]